MANLLVMNCQNLITGYPCQAIGKIPGVTELKTEVHSIEAAAIYLRDSIENRLGESCAKTLGSLRSDLFCTLPAFHCTKRPFNKLYLYALVRLQLAGSTQPATCRKAAARRLSWRLRAATATLLDLGLLRNLECVIDLYPKVP